MTLRRATILLIVGVSAGSSSCRRSAPTSKTDAALAVQQRPVLQLELKLLSNRLTLGEPVVAQYTVRNTSLTPAWLNGRFSQNHPRSFEVEREIWFDVARADGREVAYPCVTDVLPAGREDYVVLEGGRTLSKTLEIECYDFQPGRYRVVAFYLDGNPRAPAAAPGSVHFREMLVSNQETLEIAATSGEVNPGD